jgi:saccharopine dehydrogenase-like NADP-dependent oxidoreductase
MNILVLGGGAQGRVIASDLARVFAQARVTVADLHAPELPALPNLEWIEADLSDATASARLMRGCDLAVGALPSRYGTATMRAAIEARKNLVDVSFAPENAMELDAEARAAGIFIVPDCGVAPGLSHLLVGRAAAARGRPSEVTIMVGGVAQDPSRPYGYTVTWSLDDLLEEYTRPARIVRGGLTAEVPVFSGLEHVAVDGVGTMEAFFSDGLRTLIDTLPGVPEMGEKTLRWPGHVAAVRPLVANGTFVDEMRARCVVDPPNDLLALVVRVRWEGAGEESTVVDRYDPATRLSAMARTTALTTSAGAQLAVNGLVRGTGVLPLEKVGRDAKAFEFMLGALARHRIAVRTHAI